MEKQAKIVQIQEMLMQNQKPSDLLDNWFSMYSINQGYFYMIMHSMSGLSITVDGRDTVNEFLDKYYRDDVCYMYVLGNYAFNGEDFRGWITGEMQPKTKLAAYFPATRKLIYYDKTLDIIRELNDLKEII